MEGATLFSYAQNTTGHAFHSASPFGGTTSAITFNTTQQMSFGFGAPTQTYCNPFATPTMSSTPCASPFGMGTNALPIPAAPMFNTSSSPFGVAPAASPFASLFNPPSATSPFGAPPVSMATPVTPFTTSPFIPNNTTSSNLTNNTSSSIFSPSKPKARNRSCFESQPEFKLSASQSATNDNDSCNLARYASPTKKSRQMMEVSESAAAANRSTTSCLGMKRKRPMDDGPNPRLNTFRTNNVSMALGSDQQIVQQQTQQHQHTQQQAQQPPSPPEKGQEKDAKRGKTEHRQMNTRDLPYTRAVKVRFGVELKTTVDAKILFKEAWGVMVQMLEDNEQHNVTKGQKWWCKYSGVVNPMTCVPVLDAVHPT